MKRFLLSGLLVLGLGQLAAHAQQRGSYKDDIYFSSEDAKKEAEAKKQAQAEREAVQAEQRQADENTYSSSGNSTEDYGGNSTQKRSYQSDADGDGYIDDNDDMYYATRMNRFGYNSVGFGYYSPFYDPFWYDPWYSPYWGPRSGVVVSMGWGWGPSWGGCWNCWGYPYGGYGWGGYPYGGWGYPYGGGYWAGYNNGFYDGYGAGGYGGYGGYGNARQVNYGPRTSVGSGSYGPRGTTPGAGAVRQQRLSAPANGNPAMAGEQNTRFSTRDRDLPQNGAISNGNNTAVESRRGNIDNSRRSRFEETPQVQQAPEQRMQRSRGVWGSGRNTQSGSVGQGNNNAIQEQPRRSAPVYEQRRSSPSYDQPRMSSPSRNSGSMGSSPGGFGNGGSGGRRR